MKKFIIAATVLFSFSVISAQEKDEKGEKGIKTEKTNNEKYDGNSWKTDKLEKEDRPYISPEDRKPTNDEGYSPKKQNPTLDNEKSSSRASKAGVEAAKGSAKGSKQSKMEPSSKGSVNSKGKR
jgi:hypothetical protein